MKRRAQIPVQAKRKHIRCAIITRVSTDDQARGEYSSLKSQKDICEHYVSVQQLEGWVTTHYFEDAGYSGKNMDRPGIQALLAEVRAGNVDVVIAYKIDRISRCLPDFYDFWRVLAQHGVTGREAEVLRLLGEGLANAAIAERLYLSVRTVETHVSSLLSKLHVEGRGQLIALSATIAYEP